MKKAFTLVELLVITLVISILSTIAFISFQSYWKESRDTKRLSDVSKLLTRVNVEYTKTKDFWELIKNTKQTTLKILWEDNYKVQTFWEANFHNLRENELNFRDPFYKEENYPLAFASGKSHEWAYKFVQAATINEKEDKAVIRWNYYTENDDDAKSLFVIWKDTILEDDWDILPYPLEKAYCENVENSPWAIFYHWKAIEPNQAWQDMDPNAPCYVVCNYRKDNNYDFHQISWDEKTKECNTVWKFRLTYRVWKKWYWNWNLEVEFDFKWDDFEITAAPLLNQTKSFNPLVKIEKNPDPVIDMMGEEAKKHIFPEDLALDRAYLKFPKEWDYIVKIRWDLKMFWNLEKLDENWEMLYKDEFHGKILSVERWDNMKWETMIAMFRYANSLKKIPEKAPNLAYKEKYKIYYLESMYDMFSNASNFNQNISHWNISRVKSFFHMFWAAKHFNQNLSRWYISANKSLPEKCLWIWFLADSWSLDKPKGCKNGWEW